MNDHLIMLIVFGVVAALIAVGRVIGVLSKPEEDESLMSKINRAEMGDVASPFYAGKSIFEDK